MKTWFSQIFGKAQKPPPADGDGAVAPQADADQTIPADTGRTVLASSPSDPHAIHAAEAQVAAEWRVCDVILDLYEVKHVFEGGGMGLVYRVHHRGWNTDLAVKSPRNDYFKTEGQKENFTRECETWINLGIHPQIVSCHYVRTLGGIPRVFAEYVEGGTLKEWIDSRKLYEGGEQESLKRILDIAIQMAWGLHYAHEQRVIHQDVKPANVLMMPDGTAKITDFGLAKARAASGDPVVAGARRSILVSSGGMTPAYCSPEQANKQALSRKTDIWSWAVSVLEMFVGEVTWAGGQAARDVLEEFVQTNTRANAHLEMPSGLFKVLCQCLERDLEQRADDLRLVASQLQTVYRELTTLEYSRKEPTALELRADSLNNRAASFMDLGQWSEAEDILKRVLNLDAGHLHATYNLGMRLWRTGRATDSDILTALSEAQRNVPHDWTSSYLMGLVHLERFDSRAAVLALEHAKQLGGTREVESALLNARTLESKALGLVRVFEGSKEPVSSVFISTGGRWLLSGSHDCTLRLWELTTGKCVRVFEGHKGQVTSICLSEDGCWVLSGSHDNTLRLWDAATGRCIRVFEGHNAYVKSVCLSADGRWALSGSVSTESVVHSDGFYPSGEPATVRLWETSTGRCVQILKGHTDDVNSVCLSRNGLWALSAGGYRDKTLRLWELATGDCLRTFQGHTGSVNSVVISADSRFALSGSSGKPAWSEDSPENDNVVCLWDIEAGRCLKTFKGHKDSVNSVCLSANGRWALSGSNDKTLRLWEVATGRILRVFEDVGHTAYLSSDGQWALSNGNDTLKLLRLSLESLDQTRFLSTAALCRPATIEQLGSMHAVFLELMREAQSAVQAGQYGGALAWLRKVRALPGYGTSAEVVSAWHTAGSHSAKAAFKGARCLKTFHGHSDRINTACLSADSRWAMSGGRDKTLRRWETITGRCVRVFNGHVEEVHSVCFSSDGRLALSGSGGGEYLPEDTILRLWDVSSGECLRKYEGHDGFVNSVCISDDGRWALSGSGGGNFEIGNCAIGLWDISTGRCLKTFVGHDSNVNSVCFTKNGLCVVSGGDATLRLWEISSGRCMRVFKGHKYTVNSVSSSLDGHLVLSGSLDNTLRLWELASGQCLRVFEGHTDAVNSVCWAADGRWVFSGSQDKTVRLWEVATGKCLRVFEGHLDSITSVCVSDDARWLLSASADRTLRLWELDWDYQFPGWSDWNDGAKPYIENFLARHCAATMDSFQRLGAPIWNNVDWLDLLRILQCAGYGWLRPEGVGNELERLKAEWKGPPPFSWEQAS